MAEPTPQQRIESDLKTAMKAGRKDQVGTLRMLLAELKNERIRRGDDVDEPGFLAIVRKMIKQRDDSAAQYDKGHRPELAAKEREEAAYLQEEYLPKGPSEDEIRQAVESFVEENDLSGMSAMGQVMPAMIERFEGRADNAVVSKVARAVLQSRE
jgi:uncharacterized protein YqeY